MGKDKEMNTLLNIDPWKFLDEVLDVASPSFRDARARASGRFPPVNVFLDDDAILIDLELPGRTSKDVELTLEPQAVIIAGKPKEDDAEKKDKTPQRPAWSRRIELPFRVNAEKANAKFTNGILRIELPKPENTAVRTIAIEG